MVPITYTWNDSSYVQYHVTTYIYICVGTTIQYSYTQNVLKKTDYLKLQIGTQIM